jgi:hypothetical protein
MRGTSHLSVVGASAVPPVDGPEFLCRRVTSDMFILVHQGEISPLNQDELLSFLRAFMEQGGTGGQAQVGGGPVG